MIYETHNLEKCAKIELMEKEHRPVFKLFPFSSCLWNKRPFSKNLIGDGELHSYNYRKRGNIQDCVQMIYLDNNLEEKRLFV